MKRMRFLFGQRRMQVLLTLAVLLLAVSVVIGSGANFTSQSANPSNTFTAGNLKHVNSRDGLSIVSFTSPKMKPGDIATGTVDITNNGDIPGTFTLGITPASLVETAGLGAGPSNLLSQLLQVQITETPVLPTPGPGVVIRTYVAGTLATMPALNLGSYAAGEKRSYEFKVRWPDGTSAVDNARKTASMTIGFTWDAVTL